MAAAKARFYPALSIEAGVGYEAFQGRRLLTTPDSRFYGIAGNIMAPLLNRRGIKAEYFLRIAMEVLLTRRDALEAQIELIETRLRQKRALVDVYQALGGGWR